MQCQDVHTRMLTSRRASMASVVPLHTIKHNPCCPIATHTSYSIPCTLRPSQFLYTTGHLIPSPLLWPAALHGTSHTRRAPVSEARGHLPASEHMQARWNSHWNFCAPGAYRTHGRKPPRLRPQSPRPCCRVWLQLKILSSLLPRWLPWRTGARPWTCDPNPRLHRRRHVWVPAQKSLSTLLRTWLPKRTSAGPWPRDPQP